MTTPEYLEYLMKPIETDDSVPPHGLMGYLAVCIMAETECGDKVGL